MFPLKLYSLIQTKQADMCLVLKQSDLWKPGQLFSEHIKNSKICRLVPQMLRSRAVETQGDSVGLHAIPLARTLLQPGAPDGSHERFGCRPTHSVGADGAVIPCGWAVPAPAWGTAPCGCLASPGTASRGDHRCPCPAELPADTVLLSGL